MAGAKPWISGVRSDRYVDCVTSVWNDNKLWLIDRTRGAWQQTGDECLYLPNCQTIWLLPFLHCLLFWHFINTTAFLWADTSLYLLLRNSPISDPYQFEPQWKAKLFFRLEDSACDWWRKRWKSARLTNGDDRFDQRQTLQQVLFAFVSLTMAFTLVNKSLTFWRICWATKNCFITRQVSES